MKYFFSRDKKKYKSYVIIFSKKILFCFKNNNKYVGESKIEN